MTTWRKRQPEQGRASMKVGRTHSENQPFRPRRTRCDRVRRTFGETTSILLRLSYARITLSCAITLTRMTGDGPAESNAPQPRTWQGYEGAGLMIQLRLGRHASCVGLAAAILTGCGVLRQAQDDMPTIGATGAMPQGRLNHERMASSSGGDLLYVDQGYTLGKHPRGGVLIYTYPGGALVGQFTVSNPSYPPATTEGMCSDSKGDVFIEAEYYYGTTIYEYAHGG